MKKDKSLTLLKQLSAYQLIEFYDLLPDILFWINDLESKCIYANQAFIEHLGLPHLEQIIGRDDFTFSPAHLAKQFITDDKKVMKGEKVTNRMELNISNQENIAWYATSKRKLLDDEGNIIGTYGLTRHLTKMSKSLNYMTELESPIHHIRQHYDQHISIENLAKVSHLSVSALERRFKKYLAKTPNQFINEFRLEQARKMLIETELSIAEISYRVGFTDPSYFARKFHMLFDALPSEFRAREVKT